MRHWDIAILIIILISIDYHCIVPYNKFTQKQQDKTDARNSLGEAHADSCAQIISDILQKRNSRPFRLIRVSNSMAEKTTRLYLFCLDCRKKPIGCDEHLRWSVEVDSNCGVIETRFFDEMKMRRIIEPHACAIEK